MLQIEPDPGFLQYAKNEVKNIIELYHNKTLFCKLSQYPNQPILNSRIIYSSIKLCDYIV